MQKKNRISILLLAGALTLLSYDLPKDWVRAGNQPNKYEMGTDPGAGINGKNAATIRSIKKHVTGFGTLMQHSMPDKYLGKRVRMTGYMKSQDVDGWGGFWFRVDGKEKGKVLSFDNMQNRSVKGNTEWKKYEIVLDVPENAAKLAYGALLSGTGQIWFDDVNFEIVDKSVAITGTWMTLNEPSNLNFEQ